MPKRKKQSKPKTVAQKLEKLPFEELIRGQNVQSLRRFLISARAAHTRRLTPIKKSAETSIAQIQFDSSGKRKSLSEMNWNQLLIELAREQSFFQSQTSTLTGIQELNREQDSRIFGIDDEGNPRGTMSPDERRRYWELYNEFQSQKNVESSRFGSNDTQRMLGEMMLKGEDGVQLTTLFDRMEQRLQQMKTVTSAREAFNVFAGTGDGFTH